MQDKSRNSASTPPADIDPEETREWVEALEAVIDRAGTDRAHYLLERLIDKARRSGAYLPYSANTAYVNTIPAHLETKSPGDAGIEWRIRSLVRWNAMVMVLRANKTHAGLGGHIASFASAATLYDVGFNHFFRARGPDHGGDLVYVQGHSAPGIYARAFLEGRLTANDLDRFRQEVNGGGLASYPHPWLMPHFWQFPTVSMGLGPIMAIYQARFLRHLEDRGLLPAQQRKVWAFMGDGEMDEPESMGAIGLAARERLDNLIFVINCNLQRLDGPVRGNGKIIQELEASFRGAGWNVIKVIWGSYWDPLLARDTEGLLQQRMEECVDGEYQAYKAFGGAYVRQHFFGKYAKLKALVSNMTDDDIWRLNRGGHDPHKIYAAYAAAVKHSGQPTVILAKTVKGYGMGDAGEGQNITHQQKKMDIESLRDFRDRFEIPLNDAQLETLPYYRPPDASPEQRYLQERRSALGGYLPARQPQAADLKVPDIALLDTVLKGSGDRAISTTMAFVRILSALLKDTTLGSRIVPIVADEARTFGMEGLFRQLGIYASGGQLYEPVDHDQVMFYREDKKGQILEEGISEAGAICSWIAAGTAYANHGLAMIPFFIFYSMFGFQRVGDLAWAAGDSRTRGFLLGGTAGRTTLAGEGLQHQDGHSHLLAGAVPNCKAYDPAFGYELAVIVHDGLKRMLERREDVYYYITVMNENYVHPAMPEGIQDHILKGMYRLQELPGDKLSVQLLGAGSILNEVIAAAGILHNDYGIGSTVWSVTSFTELARDGRECERWNKLHPTANPKTCHVQACLTNRPGPVIAASDYVHIHVEQLRGFISAPYHTLGTDGFGRSDTREQLRRHFEVDRHHIAFCALYALSKLQSLDPGMVESARVRLGIDAHKPNPLTS